MAMAIAPRADLLQLQSRMKQDPEGYDAELELQLRHFRACLDVLALGGPVAAESGGKSAHSAAAAPDPASYKELGDMAMFLAHVTPSYPKQMTAFPQELLQLLKSLSSVLPSALRRQLTQALILLRNREKIALVDILPVMLNLQASGDKTLRKLAFSHVVQNICSMNRKHRNEAKNRALQNIIFPLLQEDDEGRAKRALVLLCELYRRKIWTDARCSNAICSACFHRSSRVMIATLKFLHGYDARYDGESDNSDNEEEERAGNAATVVSVSKEAIYKAHHKGTVSSRKKKQAKLERAIRSVKRQQRLKMENEGRASFAPLQQLQDPQEFAEKLFARLQKCNEKFQVKLMIIMVISRCIGMHQLLLLNFYHYLQRYVAPQQQNETQLLAAVVQACHEKVPSDAVEALLKQLVNSFVHDRSRPEVIAVGLNVVREMCTRMPLIMTRDLLEDLSMYKKSREKAVSSAANSIIGLYRQVHPGLLKKKDRGRGTDLSVQPKAFGEAVVHADVPGIELLAEHCSDEDEDDAEHEDGDTDEEGEGAEDDGNAIDENAMDDDAASAEDGEAEDSIDDINSDEDGAEDDEDEDGASDIDSPEDDGVRTESESGSEKDADQIQDSKVDERDNQRKRRKIDGDISGIDLKDMSLSQLKMLAAAKKQDSSIDIGDGILSNEDFERIRKLQAKREAETALHKSGLKSKLQNPDSLGQRPVNPSILEANIRKKQTKDERIATSKAGREERGVYSARSAVKKKKTGGSSNREKEKKKSLPVAARRMKASRVREQRKSKSRLSKQFRGKKGWK